MSVEFLNQLEDKVDSLIETIYNLKKEKEVLQAELEQNRQKIKELEEENINTKKEAEALRADAEKRLSHINMAAEKIQALLKKLEAVN